MVSLNSHCSLVYIFIFRLHIFHVHFLLCHQSTCAFLLCLRFSIFLITESRNLCGSHFESLEDNKRNVFPAVTLDCTYKVRRPVILNVITDLKSVHLLDSSINWRFWKSSKHISVNCGLNLVSMDLMIRYYSILENCNSITWHCQVQKQNTTSFATLWKLCACQLHVCPLIQERTSIF